MNRAFQTRLAILVAAMGFVAFLTLLGLHWSFQRIGRLERQLTRNQFETFRLAEEFQAQMRLLNNSILRFAGGGEPGNLAEFQGVSDALNRWIDSYDPVSNPASIVTSEK